MINVDKILDIAIAKGASDIHLISGLQPMLRIIRELIPIDDFEVLRG